MIGRASESPHAGRGRTPRSRAEPISPQERTAQLPSSRVRRRLQPLPTLQTQLAADIAARAGVSPETATRMAGDIMKDLALPLAELIHVCRRAVDDHVLFDTPLEGVQPGEEEVSTELNGLVLDTAAACLTGRAAALEMAEAYSRRAPSTPPAGVVALPPRPAAPAPITPEEAAA